MGMGWRLESKLFGNKMKYRIYCRENQSYITDWSTKEQVVKRNSYEILTNAKIDIIKGYMVFPDQIIGYENDEGASEYYEWLSSIVEHEDFHELVDQKYQEINSILDKSKCLKLKNSEGSILTHMR